MKEQKFPIYFFSARWSEDGVQDPKYPKWYEGLPEGRVWNSTGFHKMFREEQTQEQLDAFVQDWWKRFLVSKNEEDSRFKIINPELQYLKAEYKKHDTWVLTWFQHETFDIGQTDEEALQSFEDYVSRIEDENRGKPEMEGIPLMGAEDRWRWRGADENGNYSEDAPAPCRCKYCKEQGVLRIAH
jgi:hypothetical protein